MPLPPPPESWDTLDEFAGYARTCIVSLCLIGWGFHWDRALRRMGCCHPVTRRISMSRYFVEANLKKNPQLVLRVLLHELAHALAWASDGASGHGEAWSYWCAELGIPGERATARVEDFTPAHLRSAPRYVLCHEETGEIFRRYRRKPRRTAEFLRRCYIPGRREETQGHLVIRQALPEQVENGRITP